MPTAERACAPRYFSPADDMLPWNRRLMARSPSSMEDRHSCLSIRADDTSVAIAKSWRNRLEERVVGLLAEDLPPDRRQHLIVVVVTDVEGEITHDALNGTRTIQRPRATRSHAGVDGLARQVLAAGAGAAARRLRLGVAPALPQRGDVPQPEMHRLDVQRHRRHVVLHVR